MHLAPKDTSLHCMPHFVKWFCFQGVKYNLHRMYYTQGFTHHYDHDLPGKRPTQQATRQRQKQEGTVFMFLRCFMQTEKDGQLQQTQSLIFLSHSEGSGEILPSPLSLFSTDNVSLTTNICRNNNFIVTNIFLSQQMFCCDKHTLVATKDVFCHKLLSWQKWYLGHLPPMIPVSSCSG